MRTVLLLVCLFAAPALASAQEIPVTAHNRGLYGGLSTILLASAELMPEEKYGYEPTPEVRSFGQIVGHVADSQYFFCAAALGEKNPAPKIEQTRTSKAELVAGLKDAIAYCDRAYAALTEANAADMLAVNMFGGQRMPRLGVLSVNMAHAALHYGNLIVYLRMNGIVPPSSDAELMSRLTKRPGQ